MSGNQKQRKTPKSEFLGTAKHMKRGLSFFKKGEHQRAIEQFELILLHDKSYVRAYNNLGYVCRTIGDYDKALKVWTDGLQIDPSYRRLQKNITSLKQFLESKEARLESPPLGIEDFEFGMECLSENAELGEIRKGRFFEAYFIEDDGERYVLKTPRKPVSANRAMLQAFERACSAWLQLGRNKYVVHARSLEWLLDRPFLVLEHVPAGSLRSFLSNVPATGSPEDGGRAHALLARGGVSLTQILELAVQLCLGAHFIHTTLGVPHGDIRPENLLLCRVAATSGERDARDRSDYYSLKLTDVGQWALFEESELFCDSSGNVLSRFAERKLVRTQSGFLTTHIHSCAPELLESLRAPSVATDVYAFGVVLYEMLTGALPFSGSHPTELLEEMREGRVEQPSILNSRIPPVVSDITMRCLERSPQARFEDFSAIAKSIIHYLASMQSALSELRELCKPYKKISGFQFRNETNNASVMIVGGTESCSEMDQLWEICRRQSEEARDTHLQERLETIEKALLIPGRSLGEIYPTPASMTDSFTLVSPDEYREELNAVLRECGTTGMPVAGEETGVLAGEPAELPMVRSGDAEDSEDGILGPDVAAQYRSLLHEGDSDRALGLLASGLKLRAETDLLELPDGHDLLSAFRTIANSTSFNSWVSALFDELSAVSSCPNPQEFLDHGAQTPSEIIAAISGLLFMLGSNFSAALETFNTIPEERYLPALDIYLWALAQFQSPKLEEIRLNSLKNAAGLLRETIVAGRQSEERSATVLSVDPKAALADTFFLQGLVLERLAEYKQAISHFRAYKKIISAQLKLHHKALPWANLMQGKCLYDLGMPGEGLIRWQRVLMRELEPPLLASLELGRDRPRVLLADYLLQSCEDALALFSDNVVLWCLRGRFLNCVGRNADAIDCASRVITIDEDSYPAFFIKMESFLSMDRCEEALDAVRLCMLREPFSPSFMLREAEILCRLGEPDEALKGVKKAIEYGLDVTELHASVRKRRLTLLDQFDDFKAMTESLDSE